MAQDSKIESKPPRPEGAVYSKYNPMSPPTWDLAPFNTHVYVYKNIHVALEAMAFFMGVFRKKWARELPDRLVGETIFYRGQSEITQRLLPTRFRGPRVSPAPRTRHDIGASQEVREHEGDWIEQCHDSRSVDKSLIDLPPACPYVVVLAGEVVVSSWLYSKWFHL